MTLEQRASSAFAACTLIVVITATILTFLSTSACDPMTPSTKEDLAADGLQLFKEKVVVKDPDSNLCLVILRGDLGKRPVLETHVVRCKSEKHLLDPVAEETAAP